MLNQVDTLRNRWHQLLGRFHHNQKDVHEQADGMIDVKPDVSDEPLVYEDNRAKVKENEDASLQDKSYSFDEDNTDADYEFEDDLNFQDDSSRDESRLS